MAVPLARLATVIRQLSALTGRGGGALGEPSERQPGHVPGASETDHREEPASVAERLGEARSVRETELSGSLTGVISCGGYLAEPRRTLLPGARRDGNLTEVAEALRAARIEYGIVPDQHPRHRLAIAPGRRGAVLDAFAAAFAGQAVYADLLEHGRTLGTVLADQLPAVVALVETAPTSPETDHRDGRHPAADQPAGDHDSTGDRPTRPADRVKGVRLYRPAAIGDLVYGAEVGCDVEFWDAAPSGGVVASIDETPLGWWLPSLEAGGSMVIDGTAHPLPAVFATTLSDRVDFPIDAVITWVDDSDPRWQERRAAARARLAHTAGPVAPEDGLAASGIAGDADQRFRNRDELRYCLRGLASYAPWIRHIYLVTDDQIPSWLDTERPGLTVVSHRELFAGTGVDGVFNSHAIETRLHLLPGLAEHFLYINDDVFLGRALTPEDFFLGNGTPRYFPDSRIIPPGSAAPEDSVYVAAQKNTRAALATAVAKTYPRTLKHAPHPLLRSVLAESAERFATELRGTVRSEFRSATDLAPVTLAVHYADATARTVEGHLYDGYFVTDRSEDIARLAELREERWADYFCLADGTGDQLTPEQQEEIVTDFLRSYFPAPSPFELPGPRR